MARTHRSPDKAFAGVGAVHQTGGSLPVYICETCGAEVVWATSKRTGRAYLANVHRGYLDQRFYIAVHVHNCAPRLTRAEEADWEMESRNFATYQLHLVNEHRDPGHPFNSLCILCEARALHP